MLLLFGITCFGSYGVGCNYISIKGLFLVWSILIANSIDIIVTLSSLATSTSPMFPEHEHSIGKIEKGLACKSD